MFSGLCIVTICLVILARVVGRWFGIEVPSSDDFAGFLLIAASFLGLAYTFREGGHIRVSLFTSRMPVEWRHRMDILVLVLASLLTLYLTYYLSFMAYESYLFEEVSAGYIPVPLWIVQSPMGFGMLALAIAIIDQTVACIWFGEAIPDSEELALMDQQPIDTKAYSSNLESQND
jgi:TRAP-type C4-dicarboxylate transport system permease small subunit